MIKSKVNEELITENYVSFEKFSNKFAITKQVKGELFYQLLHMGFELTQKSPQDFGDILIYNRR